MTVGYVGAIPLDFSVKASGSAVVQIAIEVTPGLAIAMTEPLRMTTKSDIAAYHVEEP